MTVMGKNDISELLKLGATERLAIAEQLWESVTSDAERLPATESGVAFIDQRLDAYLKNSQDTVPWSQVKKDLGL
jgi:putative addiction module component (TIGR02574 family)